MKRYTFKFYGRQTGAIGIKYDIVETYEAKDLSEAKAMLWYDYEPQRIISMTVDRKSINQKEYDGAPWIENFKYERKQPRK